ncbi:MAG TPA: CopD family protein, partial [Steroidobacteraceae bacterium]|nr:CopD family protein [Steroidobacteraceae bacterium]
EPARLAGELSGFLDPAMWRTALGAGTASASTTRLSGLLLLCLALRAARAAPAAAATMRMPEDGAVRVDGVAPVQVLGVLASALALFSFVLTGHTAVSPRRWLLCPLLLAHLCILAFWCGALPGLRIVSLCESGLRLVGVMRAFSRLAVWLVPLILIAGGGLALGLVPSLAVLRQPYGEILLGKVAAFALLMALAAWNQLRLTAAIESGAARAVSALRLSVSLEQLLIAMVLVATAIMTGLFSPEAG